MGSGGGCGWGRRGGTCPPATGRGRRSSGCFGWDVSVDSTIARAHQHAAGARKRGPGGRAGPTTPVDRDRRRPARRQPAARRGRGRPRTRPDRVLADKAYSSRANRPTCAAGASRPRSRSRTIRRRTGASSPWATKPPSASPRSTNGFAPTLDAAARREARLAPGRDRLWVSCGRGGAVQTLRHVLWIGGPPGAGKSSVATRIARRYGLRWYNADTRTWQHRDRALRAGNAAARRWEAMTPKQRWVGSTPRQMLEGSLHANVGRW